MFPTHVYHRAYTATAVSSMTRARRFEFTIAEVSRVRTRSHHLTRLKTIQIAHVVISQQRRSFHRIQTSCFSFHSFLLNFTSSRILRRKKKKKREREFQRERNRFANQYSHENEKHQRDYRITITHK